MKKKTRIIILLSCVACFVIIAPVLVLYSMGYRVDLEKMKIVATGGIYVRTFPAANQVSIDSGLPEKPGMFGNSIFVQSLLPKNHTVSIKKSGYYDYFKTLLVKENQVTKLENVLLIKKTIAFSSLGNKINYFSPTPNNQNALTSSTSPKGEGFNYFSLNDPTQKISFLIADFHQVSNIKWSNDSNEALIDLQDNYYLFDVTSGKATKLSFLDRNCQQITFDPQDSQTILYIKNKTLYAETNNLPSPIINSIVSFKLTGNNIIWLSTKGILYTSDASGKTISQDTLQNFPVNNQKSYQIIFIPGKTFLEEDKAIFFLDTETKAFKEFIAPISDYQILLSPDSKNILYWNSNKIYLYSYEDQKYNQLFSGDQTANCQWLNNSYIIFSSGNKIIISEIDYRGNINTVTFPETIALGHEETNIQNPSAFFDQQNGKLYVLTNNTLISSEKITP